MKNPKELRTGPPQAELWDAGEGGGAAYFPFALFFVPGLKEARLDT